MKPFAEMTHADAVAAVDAAKLAPFATAGKAAEEYAANEAFAERRDHWQDGAPWPGPRGTPQVWAMLKAAILAQFTPVDVVNEVLDRVADGLLKREPAAGFAPVAPEPEPPKDASEEARKAYEARRATIQARADAVTAPLMAWWDREQLWRQARQVVRRARWAGRGVWRLWVPPGMLETTTAAPDGEGAAARPVRALPTGLSLAAALRRIKLAAPAPDAAAVITNPDTQARCAVFLFTRTDETGQHAAKFAELWFLNDAPDAAGGAGAADDAARPTVVRVVGEGENVQTETYTLDLGGRLPLLETPGDVLLTDPVRRQQHALNFSETLVNRVLETAGFAERYVLDAAPSGVWLDTKPAGGQLTEERVGQDGKTYYLHPVPPSIGAGIRTEVQGREYVASETAQQDGSVTRTYGVTTPSVQRFEPVDPAYAITVGQHRRAVLLESCHQGHVLANGTGQISGYSRDVARADHETDLANTKTPLEGSLRELLETVVAFVTPMCAGGPDAALLDGFLADYRATVDLHLWTGPVSPDEQRSIIERKNANVLSEESAMALGGVEDVDAERARIAAQPSARTALVTQQATAIKALTDAGAAVDGAAALVGVPADVARALATGQGDGGGPPSVRQ